MKRLWNKFLIWLGIRKPNPTTLAGWAKRLDPDGKVDKIAELLAEQNDILEDMTFMEQKHITKTNTTLPTVYWRSTNAKLSDAQGVLEAWSEEGKL